MILTIIITFISLIGLLVIHEFGHFILAKKFGLKVEEFGIGFPPRIFGKKIGETIYSLNLLPLGAFVRIYGEEGGVVDNRSFSQKPIWQRALIVLAGVISFWLVAIVILSIVMALGAATAISDNENGNLKNVMVQIAAVSSNSPAQKVGIRSGDAIEYLKFGNLVVKVDKANQVQEFIDSHKGQEITLTIKRGKEVFDVNPTPRLSPPAGEGALGVSLVRTAIKAYPWYQSIWRGIVSTFNLTISVVQGWAMALVNLIKGLPTGVQLMGPVGIFSLFNQAGQLGATYFLQFIAIISIYLAVFNMLPIPAVDGGRFLFLAIEAIRRRPISPKVEQRITAFFFSLLMALMIWVTIKDIIRIF